MSTAAQHPDLHHPILMPDLIASVLNRGGSHPVLHLAEADGSISTVSYNEMRDAVSRYAQALRGRGFAQGDTIALLSANRAEVLYAFGANSMVGLRGTSMHPLGTLDDHVYVLEDAAIATLDATPLARLMRHEARARAEGRDLFARLGRELAEQERALRKRMKALERRLDRRGGKP